MITRDDFVADQLRALSPGVDWNVAGIDRAAELARIFTRAGITDLWALKFIPVSEVVHHPDDWTGTEGNTFVPAHDETVNGYAFEYYGRRIGFLGTPTRSDNAPMLQSGDAGLMIAWSAEGHGNVAYVVRANRENTSLQFAPVWASSSDAGAIRSGLMMFASLFVGVVLPMAGISVGSMIGNAVLPAAIAAEYPLLASAIGNVALSTAFNGGDVEGAVKGVVINAFSGGAGDMVGSAVGGAIDSQLIGSLANAGVRAAIAGGDIKMAIGTQLLKAGSKMDTSAFDFFSSADNSYYESPAPSVFSTDPLMNSGTMPTFYAMQDGGIGVSYDPFSFDPFQTTNGGLSLPVAGQPVVAPVAPPAAVAPPANSPAWNPTQLVQNVSTAALSALSVLKAYRQLDQPQVNNIARLPRANGSVSAISDNGLIQTRDASGRITSARPPVGVPQSTVNGNLVVNNGDGTYAVVSPSGQVATYHYASGAGAAAGSLNIPPALLWGGGALLVALLLKR